MNLFFWIPYPESAVELPYAFNINDETPQSVLEAVVTQCAFKLFHCKMFFSDKIFFIGKNIHDSYFVAFINNILCVLGVQNA